MRKQYKFPYVGLLLFVILLLAFLIYGASVFLREIIGDSLLAFRIYSVMLSVAGIFCGALWMGSTKSYTAEEFSDTFENTRICDHIIYLAQQRKQELKDLKKEK